MSGKARLTGALAKHADRSLPKVARLFDAYDISYCLDGGTLLGLYREGRFLPWDNDIDFFVKNESADRIKSLWWRLLFLGFKLEMHEAEKPYGPIGVGSPRIYKLKSIQRFDGRRLIIDLIFKYPDESHYHWVIGKNPSVHKKVERKFYDRFDELKYRGRSYPIPCDTAAYLTHRYGDWRRPVQDYNFKTDDRAIVEK